MRRVLYVTAAVVVVGLIISGCTGPLSLVPNLPSELDGLVSPQQAGGESACGEPTVVTLYAGQTLDVGTVTVWNDRENLYVKYSTTGGWALAATHLAVATSLEEIPQTKKGNLKIGHFPYKMKHEPVVTDYLYAISLDEFGYAPGTDLYIAAHAEAQLLDGEGRVIQEEGAWGDGDDFAGNSWAMYFEYAVQSCVWTLFTNVGVRIVSVDMLSTSDGWAVGMSGSSGVIFHYDGASWTPYPAPAEVTGLRTIHMVSIDDGWAAGEGGLIYHYVNGAWTLHTATVEGRAIHSIEMLSADDGWAVGGGGLIYRYDGDAGDNGEWTLEAGLGGNLFSVDMLSAKDGWACGAVGRIYHYNGDAWETPATTVETPTTGWMALWSIDMVSATDGWAVGNFGLIYQYDGDEDAWTLHTATAEGTDLLSIDMVADNDGWAVGRKGRIYHYDGVDWSLDTTMPNSSAIESVCMVSATDGWAVANGLFYRYW